MSLTDQKINHCFQGWRKYHPLLAILVLTLAALACINTEITLKVNQQEDSADTLDVSYQQYLIPSYVVAAEDANQERAADFAAAGRDPGEPFLPTSRADLAEAFDGKKYQDLGYATQLTETGFSATKTFSLDQDQITEDWKVRIIQNPEHPEQTTYRVKVYIDLTDADFSDLQKLRSEPLMDKPDPNDTGEMNAGGGGLFGDLIGAASGLAEVAEGQMAIEMYYAQKAIKNSDPMEYKVTVTLPGQILIHKIEGSDAGTLAGNTVTLVLDENAMASYSGKMVEFHVESVLKDCSQACTDKPLMVWDGDEEGLSCNCACEKGYEAGEGEGTCVDCDTICSQTDPNLETDLAACEINQCGCRCKAGYQINNAGTRCITFAEADAEDRENEALADPSPPETGEEGEGTAISPAALYADLEEFLAGEGITAPTPGMMAVSGTALTSLLAAWLVLNQVSGISPQQSLEVIEAWSDGERPSADADTGHAAGTDAVGGGEEWEGREGAPDPGDEDGSVSGQRTPVREGAEDQVVRTIRDVKDIDDAIKQTREDFETLEGRIPDRVRNSEPWKNHVAPQIEKITEFIKQGELDKARTWLDRVENLIEVRDGVDKDLSHLPDDKREAIVWLERTVKGLGHIASDAYQTVVVDPAKAAGENLLPEDLAKLWGDAMDELSQDLSNTAQEIGELPRKGAELLTHKHQLEHLGPEDKYLIEELYGERDVPVEYPDFWGKGTRKVSELYNGAKNLLFGD